MTGGNCTGSGGKAGLSTPPLLSAQGLCTPLTAAQGQ